MIYLFQNYIISIFELNIVNKTHLQLLYIFIYKKVDV